MSKRVAQSLPINDSKRYNEVTFDDAIALVDRLFVSLSIRSQAVVRHCGTTLNYVSAASACNLKPSAFTTFRMVLKSGLRSPESAL